MQEIILSDISCWGNKRLVSELRDHFNLDGIELMPLKNDEASEYQGINHEISCFHGSPYVNNQSIKYRWKYAAKNERSLAIIWTFLLGTMSSNPGLELAKRFSKPIILHQEQVFEMVEARQLSLLCATKVRVENSNFLDHPLVCKTSRGLQAMLDAYDILEKQYLDPSLVIDFEHLYQSIADGSYENITSKRIDDELSKIGTRRVAAFHLSDSMMVDGKRIGHLPLGKGAMHLQDLIDYTMIYPKAELVIETGSSMDKWEFLFAKHEKRLTYHTKEIAISVDYLRNAIS